MKTKYIVLIAVVTALLTTLVVVPQLAKGDTSVTRETVYLPQPALSSAQVIWLARLMLCESRMRSNAVNKVDLNGLPSKGILQFQDSTFVYYSHKYGVDNNIWNPDAQVSIVTNWILNGGVRWTSQFPDCVKKLGEPPLQ